MATLLAVTALSAALSAAGPALRPFDPLALLQDKAAQTTALKSLGVPGREVATLALGWFWHPEAALAAIPGIRRTAVGFSGGRLPDPTYKRVCNEPAFGDYAEAIQLEFDPSIISYASVVEAFFGSHDFIANGRSRQYSSIIFAHDDAQRAAAEAALTARPRASTALEPFEGFWQAEPYHQKWLLQRKRELLLSLRLCDYDELTTSHAASVLNAVAAGRLSLQAAQNRLDGMLLKGEVEPEVHGSVTAMLDRL